MPEFRFVCEVRVIRRYDTGGLMNVQDIAQDWFESVDGERIPGEGFIGLFVLGDD